MYEDLQTKHIDLLDKKEKQSNEAERQKRLRDKQARDDQIREERDRKRLESRQQMKQEKDLVGKLRQE